MGSPKLSYKGCWTNFAGLSVNFRRSCRTFSLMVTKASGVFKKYLVKATSPALFSCGITLSAMQTILVCLFFFTLRRIVPNAGPIKGSQYLTTIKSGFSFLNFLPVFNQFNGFMELIIV